jgi:Cft2 family RNA processing exonuclease
MERLRPDLLISESTYATTLRDSKKSRERGFMVEVGASVSMRMHVCLFFRDPDLYTRQVAPVAWSWPA